MRPCFGEGGRGHHEGGRAGLGYEEGERAAGIWKAGIGFEGDGMSQGFGEAGRGHHEAEGRVKNLLTGGFVAQSEDEPRAPFLEAPQVAGCRAAVL